MVRCRGGRTGRVTRGGQNDECTSPYRNTEPTNIHSQPQQRRDPEPSNYENRRAEDQLIQVPLLPNREPQPMQSPHSSTPSTAASCNNIRKAVRGKYKCLNLDLKTKSGKLEIVMPDDIQRAVGNNSRDVVNFCGYIVRSLAPLFMEKEGKLVDAKWVDIISVVGEQMWIQVKEKFTVAECKQHRFQAFVIDTMRRLYRIWKHRLYEHYKRFQTDEERLENVPKDVKGEDWKLLIEYFGSDNFQKISQRNATNRAKLVTKHTCGTRSFAEVEESMRDPISGEKPPSDEILLKQHTKKDKEGELQWSDPISKEVHEKLHDLVIQQEEAEPESQLTHDEMLLQVLGQKSGYFRGIGAEKRPPTKRTKYLDNMQEEVQRAIDSARESMIESVNIDVMKNLQEEMRANVSDELRAEIRKTVEDELRNDLTTQIQNQFNAMFQARMVAFYALHHSLQIFQCLRIQELQISVIKDLSSCQGPHMQSSVYIYRLLYVLCIN